MAEESFTLSTFYEQWAAYQGHIRAAVAPLTTEQLSLRAAPHLRTAGDLAAHIAGCRAGWFSEFLGEETGDKVKDIAQWDVPGATARSGKELARALDLTWQTMMACVARWTPDDMRQTFPDDWDGKRVELSRAWVLWHVLEHDLHHGGELSLTLGMHGIEAEFPG